MKIQAVTVCVNYSDYFCWTVKENKHLFDKWVVVTDTKDEQTAKICNEHGLTCIKTDIFYKDGGFAKFAGINEGLKHISEDCWVLFVDGDIAIPNIAKRVLNELEPFMDKEAIYSVDRLDCTGLSNWIKHSSNPRICIDNWLLTTGDMPFGARIVHYYGQWGDNGRFGGYKPLGYFQLVHRSSFKDYPSDSKGADHCDMVFTNRYPRHKRHLIPEFYAIHLESPNSKWGDNWQGRTSVPFDADMKVAREEIKKVEISEPIQLPEIKIEPIQAEQKVIVANPSIAQAEDEPTPIKEYKPYLNITPDLVKTNIEHTLIGLSCLGTMGWFLYAFYSMILHQ